MTLLPGE